MGYANTIPISDITLGPVGSITTAEITTVATTLSFTPIITLPTWLNNRMKHIFLDVAIPKQRNSNGAGVNYTNGTQYIQVQIDGAGAWQNAIKISSGSCYTEISETSYQYEVFYGSYDLISYVSNGSTITMQWLNSKSLADSLFLSNIQFRLRVIAE